MTIEEAIKHLQEARQYPVAYTKQEQEAYEMAFAALRAQQEPNDPLTLDELCKMTGQPVWVDCPGRPGLNCWGLYSMVVLWGIIQTSFMNIMGMFGLPTAADHLNKSVAWW